MSAEPNGRLDTSTVILLDGIDPANLPSEPAISTITLAELSLGPLATRDRRAPTTTSLQEI